MADVLTRFGVTYANVPLPQTLTDGDGDSLANDIALTDAAQFLVMVVTMEQYTKLLSAALDGANRHWPENYIEIIYPLIKAAKVDANLCAAIAECIANSESDTYAALHDWLISQIENDASVQEAIGGVGNLDGTPIAAADTTLIADCDLDNLFGFCRQVVQLMNQLIESAFEIIEVITNDIELAIYVQVELPGLATLASFVAYLQNTLAESYIANYDVDYENDLACELFCLAQDQPGCELTWEIMTDYFAQRAATSLSGLTMNSLLTYVLSGGWSGDEFCDVSMLLLAFVMRIGGDWTGIGFGKIQQIMTSFLNDPDSDWMTLCDCGYEFVYEYDQAYQNGFNPIQGQWATPYALYSTGSSPYGITIEQTYGSPFDGLKEVSIYTNKSGSSPTVVLDITHGSGTDNMTLPVASNDWVTFVLPATRNGVSYIKFHTTTAVALSVNYNKVRLSGVGDNLPPTPVNPP